MNMSACTKAYINVGLESEVNGADPHKLIALLYQGALVAISNAKNAIVRKDMVLKGKAISHAISIIDEGLRASLDKNVGGELALNLDALYGYMSMRLLAANLNNDPVILDEVSHLLGELKGAWDGIREQVVAKQAATPIQTAVPKPQPALVYGRM